MYVTGKSELGQCIFCAALASGDDQQQLVVYRGLHNFVILNRYPYTNGHLMIAPNAHVSRLAQLTSVASEEMWRLARASETILEQVYQPTGLNVGMNIGDAAGAGIAAHIHLHVLPRWIGDANFMTVVGRTRVMPESLDDTYSKLRPAFESM